MGREVARVGVEVDDQLAARDRRARATSRRPSRAPARTRASARPPGRPRRRPAPRPRRVPSPDAASTTSTWSTSGSSRAAARRSRRSCPPPRGREHHRDRLPLALEQPPAGRTRSGGSAGSTPAYYRSRAARADHISMGGRARARAATRSWSRPPASASRPGSRSRSRTTSTPRCARRSRPPGSRRSGRTRPTRSRPRGAATRSSRPAPRAASRSPSTCRCSTRSRATWRRARSTSTRPRRSRRTRRASSHEIGGRYLRHAIYDGDTPREERRAIRQRSNLILTNPDMLHVGVLPNHRAWGDVLANLAWVVVDEAHVYRGVFGSHVANVLRRLRRLARAYGTEPRFLLTSATIANPHRAGRAADRAGVRARRPRRRAARRAPDRDVEPAARGREARPARLGARRGGQPARRRWSSARSARSAS